jgi:hypothetical protein
MHIRKVLIRMLNLQTSKKKQFFDCISISRKNAHPLGGYWACCSKTSLWTLTWMCRWSFRQGFRWHLAQVLKTGFWRKIRYPTPGD